MQHKDDSSTTGRDRRGALGRPAVAQAPPPAPGPAAARPSTAEAIRRTLASRGGLRRALLLNEILGPPVALRDRVQR